MWFLIIPVVAFIAANAWIFLKSRTPRAPEIEATIEAHRKFSRAMEPKARRRRVLAGRR